MKVKLIAYTPNPELVVATAAKLCYSGLSIDEVIESQSEDEVQMFIKRLRALGHESPFEHATFTFAIEGVSRSLLAQLTRHRIASYSVQSQRYVDMSNAECVVPPVIAEDDKVLNMYTRVNQLSFLAYGELLHLLCERYIAEGLTPSQAQKKAQEDARFILPNACDTKLIMTMNARSLMNFFKLRCCNRAQWEIRGLADSMLKLVKEVAPSIFMYAGPPCIYGVCPEGKMSCGNPRREELQNGKTE